MDAIALASRMPEGRQKNDFLAELAAGVAKRGYYEAAFSIIDSIKDASARDYSYAAIVVSAAGKIQKPSRQGGGENQPRKYQCIGKKYLPFARLLKNGTNRVAMIAKRPPWLILREWSAPAIKPFAKKSIPQPLKHLKMKSR